VLFHSSRHKKVGWKFRYLTSSRVIPHLPIDGPTVCQLDQLWACIFWAQNLSCAAVSCDFMLILTGPTFGIVNVFQQCHSKFSKTSIRDVLFGNFSSNAIISFCKRGTAIGLSGSCGEKR